MKHRYTPDTEAERSHFKFFNEGLVFLLANFPESYSAYAATQATFSDGSEFLYFKILQPKKRNLQKVVIWVCYCSITTQ